MSTFRLRRAITTVMTTFMLVASLVVPLRALAQTSNTGAITGVVKDPSGAVVSGATVKAINKGTGIERKTTTGDSGSYELTTLVPGDYRIEVEAKGFAKYAQEPVTVNVLSRVSLDADLKPAGTSETVTIAGGGALIEVSKQDIGGVMDPKQMESLPVNGRSFASLAVLIPGATLQGSYDPTKARTGTISFGGSTGRNVNITVDGADDKDNAVGGILQNFTMEGIQEFALSSQRFSAANGRSGGALLSVVNKSGTNKFHGSAFGFFRDDLFNSNAPKLLADANSNLFDPGDAVKPPFNRQQFGGSVGGALKKDKAYWFGAVEHTRERGNSIVPTQAFNEIKLLEPLGYKAVQFLPQPYDDTQWTFKADFHPRDNHSLSFRWGGQNNLSLNDQAGFLTVFTDLSGGDIQANDYKNILGSWTWTATPHLVNVFNYAFSQFNNQIVATTDLKFLTFPSGVAVGRNPNVPQQTIQTKHQFRDDITWTKGSHGFKFGADLVLEPTLGGLFAFLSAPEYDFVEDPSTIVTLPLKFNTPGIVGDIAVAGGDPKFDLRDGAKQFSWYFQDDWKVSSRLTLNLGVRYDVDIGFIDAAHQKATNRTIKALQIIGHPLGSRFAHDDKNNFSPRVGFAYDIKGNGRSVIRGGYGLYYDQSFLNVPLFAVQMANPEIYASILDTSSTLSLASPPPPFPRPLLNPVPGFPVNGRMVDPDFSAPYTQQSNLSFAQEIGKNSVIEFDYIHILGLHEFTQLNYNPRIGPLLGLQRTNPSPTRLLTSSFNAHAAEMIAAFGQVTPFSNIRVAQSDSRSRYDAFTIAYRKRYSNKIQLNLHYTLARSLAWFGIIGDFGLQPQNPFDKFDPKADFGHPGEDERHRFVASGIFDLPWGLQLSPILQLGSARPYSISPAGGVDINRDGVTNDRDTRDGNDQHKLPPGTLRGDKFAQINLRVSKFFKFKEEMKLGVFFEAFNLFNTGNFGNSFDGTTGSQNFKKPVNFFGATGFSEPIGIPFQAQFGFRFNW